MHKRVKNKQDFYIKKILLMADFCQTTEKKGTEK